MNRLARKRKIDYMPETDDMGGFCIEHVSTLRTVKVGKDTHTVEAAVAAVKDGHVHISCETLVGAISRLSETNYGAKPVFMEGNLERLPSHDRNNSRGMEAFAESRSTLSFKTFRGSIVGSGKIMKQMIPTRNILTSVYPPSSAHLKGSLSKINKAIKLVLSIVEIKNLDLEDFNPSEAAEFEAHCLLEEAFDAMIQPFINTKLTLSEQIESLIKFSHLICLLHPERYLLHAQPATMFTIGGKSWTRESAETNQNISTATHFQLSNLFTTLVCHNRTHLGLAIAKCTLIKRGASAKATSVSAIPRSELHLPGSPYTVSGQVLSLVPLAHNDITEETSYLRNLQFAVSSRLVDCNINDRAHEMSAFDINFYSDRERTWSFTNTDLQTPWYSLWNRLLANNSLHDKSPLFTDVSEGVFPYQIPSSPVTGMPVVFAKNLSKIKTTKFM
ncbi:hypothetical protein C8R44DRAFT_748625 [Mycena epipterygia]|nr:hypothetical protein C8R44DRAFT_748625 [Mycena epipterygia]